MLLPVTAVGLDEHTLHQEHQVVGLGVEIAFLNGDRLSRPASIYQEVALESPRANRRDLIR